MALATPFGVIWAGLVIASGMVANVGIELMSDLYLEGAAAAANSRATIGAIQNGLGGGIEIVGTLAAAFCHPELGYIDAHVMYKKLRD